MMVGFLREFADAEDAVGNHTGAIALRAKAEAMADAVNKYMWDGVDHFVTQVRHLLRICLSARTLVYNHVPAHRHHSQTHAQDIHARYTHHHTH